VKGPDDYSVGIAVCCAGSIFLVVILFLGLRGFADNLLWLITISILLHIIGLLLIISSLLIRKWRTEPSKYYDWGL